MPEQAPKTKRRDRRHIMFRLVERIDPETGELEMVLSPRFATDRRILTERRYRLGDDLRAELSKPRIVSQYRKAHLLGALVVAQIDGFERETQHSAIKRLQRESGICCDIETVDAGPVIDSMIRAANCMLGERIATFLGKHLPKIRWLNLLTPQSLAFDSMEQGEFERFYAGICAHLVEHYWPNLDQEQIEDMAELMEREFLA